MRRYLGKCEELPSLSMAEAGMKMKKVNVSTSRASPYNVYQLRSRRLRILTPVTENSASSSVNETTSSSDIVVVENWSSNCTELGEGYSCCSSNVNASSSSSSSGVVADQEVEETEAVTSTNFHDCSKAVAVSARQESNGHNSPAAKTSTTRSTVELKMPSDAELEDFFSAAEKDLHKRFSDKYNFDIVKDVPLEGRYEWVEIKP